MERDLSVCGLRCDVASSKRIHQTRQRIHAHQTHHEDDRDEHEASLPEGRAALLSPTPRELGHGVRSRSSKSTKPRSDSTRPPVLACRARRLPFARPRRRLASCVCRLPEVGRRARRRLCSRSVARQAYLASGRVADRVSRIWSRHSCSSRNLVTFGVREAHRRKSGNERKRQV